jgi:hypothetical protein
MGKMSGNLLTDMHRYAAQKWTNSPGLDAKCIFLYGTKKVFCTGHFSVFAAVVLLLLYPGSQFEKMRIFCHPAL